MWRECGLNTIEKCGFLGFFSMAVVDLEGLQGQDFLGDTQQGKDIDDTKNSAKKTCWRYKRFSKTLSIQNLQTQKRYFGRFTSSI